MKKITIRKKLIAITFLFYCTLCLTSCSDGSNERLAFELLQYTSSYIEFGSRAEVYDKYIRLVVWYRPNQDKERAKRFLDYLTGIAEMKMKNEFKRRPINQELIVLREGELY